MPAGTCDAHPAVVVRDGSLVRRTDGSRFFAAGWVYSGASGTGAAALSRFDAAAFEDAIAQAAALGATTIRWNACLKGLDLTFGADGLVAGVKRLDNLVAALDSTPPANRNPSRLYLAPLTAVDCLWRPMGGERARRHMGHNPQRRACALRCRWLSVGCGL